jgi:NhaP-type Na+/H+ or K+/H+ antiporter
MVPVAIALTGHRARLPTIAFIGWFGPRGLASLVFVLLAVEEGIPEGEIVLSTVVVTVGLSVLLHGLTSVPLVKVYHRWYAAHAADHPAAGEARPTTVPRRRRQLSDLTRPRGDSSEAD